MQYPVMESELERVLQPWEEHPRQLWSWFEMLHFSAHHFFYCGRALKDIRSDCIISSMGCIDGKPVLIVMRDLDEKSRKKAIAHLTNIEPTFRQIGLAITADTIVEFLDDLKGEQRRNVLIAWMLLRNWQRRN